MKIDYEVREKLRDIRDSLQHCAAHPGNLERACKSLAEFALAIDALLRPAPLPIVPTCPRCQEPLREAFKGSWTCFCRTGMTPAQYDAIRVTEQNPASQP